MSSEESEYTSMAPSTNSLGLPLIKQAMAEVRHLNLDLVVQEEDYNVYYGGISNGLLWPAMHNLPEYIVQDYDSPKV
ncbi:unnamed protein product [Strongylus vulgaris]|uniref:Uncharacterized protein n=1 Tax=Strongylus vulgaris TaxID=40348 RepID=A0A3P7M0Z7_STRVU|nr:unnamed protein product [Strongylus vulgaris]